MALPLVTLVVLTLAGAPDPYEVGIERYRQADYLAAAEAFREAVAHPASPTLEARANLWLGVCLFDINEPDSARLAFKSALLEDRTLTLPDDAPPTAQPLFDDVRRSLPAPAAAAIPAPAPPAAAAPPSVTPEVAPPTPTSPAPASPPPAPVASSAPANVEPPAAEAVSEVSGEPSPILRPWMSGVAFGVTGGLAIASGALELGAYTNLTSAAKVRYATTASQLSQRGGSEQDAARGTAVAAAGTLAVAIALYFISR